MAITASAVAALSVVATAPAAAAPQLVVNGTFSGGTAPWWKSANTSMAVDAGRLRVNVTGGTANPWDAMVGQNGISLVKGKSYTLSFDASASAAVTAVTTVQLADSPYTRTLTKTISLTTASKRFSFPFTSGVGTSAGQVSFQLGKNAGFSFYADNVSLTETTSSSPSPTPTGTTSPKPSPTPTATTSPKPEQPGSGPIAMTSGFYVDPDSNPAIWVRNNAGDSRAARIKSSISAKPMARWFGGWSGDVRAAVSKYVAAADSADKLPVLVAYNIPGRDACGGHSGGGAGSESAYKTWISAFAAGIGNRPAVVVIEPDSLGDFGCMTDTAIQARNRMLTYAAQEFRDKAPNAWAYLDAGNAGWVAAGTMATRLKNAGVGNIRGFAVNVSNYYPTTQSATYASSVNSALGGGAKWVIDTSRNGNGSNGEWCNPAGRKLGTATQTGGGGGTEMLLWVKVPGDSDGNCGIAPGTPAGQFSPAIAVRLIDGT
ncbi:glycoside hydrolase family 6 protein [Nonomuraea basaltis]|uniref:glycoside hydrolase family 6 protein n=1 Tax=Nonomuraea basaltis TaxID=2495887 RepID=UPI00110C5736|nr:glycoside hydrolase family 6 protein [Nonomuraea basaltis]TMR97218.1 endoglucanase [Nonomuraea basaltis]